MGKSDDNKKELQNCFGQVLRHARNNVGLSQEKLALETGLDRTYIFIP
jgi:cytoskeletal protein RodZ